jgi:chromosome transmission fidelity protein 1
LFSCHIKYVSPNSSFIAKKRFSWQVLLHEKTRKAWGVDLRGNVVVVDEAHNMLEAVAAVYSADVDARQLSLSQSIVQEYAQRFRSRLKASNLLYVRQLIAVLAAFNGLLSSYTKRKLATVFTLPQFMLQVRSTNCA